MTRLKDAGYRLSHAVDRWAGIPLCFFLRLFKRSRAPEIPAERTQILLIKFSLIGDTILLLPAIRALRAAHPRAHVTFVCSTINADIIRSCPYVDTVIAVDLFSLLNPLYVLRLLRGINRRRYELVVDFEQWFRFSALMAFFIASQLRAGFKTAGQHRHWLFDIAVDHLNERHEVACYGDLLRAVDIPFKDAALEWHAPASAEPAARAKLAAAGIGAGEHYIVIHPGSSHWPQKQWPEQRYAALCKVLSAAHDANIVLTGSFGEQGLVSSIMAATAGTSRVYSLAGKLSLFELGAVLAHADGLICGNTGVMHLGCAVGARVLLINGPVSAEKWGPWGSGHRVVQARTPCAPCVYLGFEYRCPQRACMESITVEDVANAYALLAVPRSR